MNKVIIIGCGGVGTGVAHKCAKNPDVFNEIVIASRHKAKCDAIVGAHYKVRIEDYFVFKKLTCEIFGYPATLKGVELIENKSILSSCGCDKK